MLLSCKKKKYFEGTLVQNVLHMHVHIHICLNIKPGFREKGDLVASYISKKNIKGQNNLSGTR